ncbi:acetyl-CoA carboxylase carboxyltransferase subunit alpha [Abyssisolibacter fermentans]|uniref:acetyl-CoA carboxylase carboxyltransferase subunit alpha n=1 Tax=Abyssisolibacter fermentans TaxID=1766203 RepID=UPI000B1C1E3B|nr:acetyl-CoA carboxylase carboxyltransferase subunit alpha [Abyssisolibacter fermentans]
MSLDKENKVIELEKKISELKEFSKKENINLTKEISILQDKVNVIKQEIYLNLTPWDKVKLSRLQARPTALDYISNIFDTFIELHGDRTFADDPSIIGGLAKFGDRVVTVIGQQKGKNTKENIYRNFGMPHPEGYRKALRLMKQAQKFNRPIVCFIDTPGAFCGIGAEERCQGEAIAKNLFEMIALDVPIISIVIGEGGSGGALALSVSDEIWMLEHSVYSILSPEGFASILWKDSSKAEEASKIMKITAQDLEKYKILDRIIEEPLGGVHKDIKKCTQQIKTLLEETLTKLSSIDKTTLKLKRYEKYRSIGEVN